MKQSESTSGMDVPILENILPTSFQNQTRISYKSRGCHCIDSHTQATEATGTMR